ncbi:MAG: helix-turn-helix transcriptional regulator [Anaerolineae bacterium]|nr:helix-turn-helix transcriptional regulator [Anaerolineae bacterium]
MFNEGKAYSPVELTMEVLGGKWKPLIIFHLLPGMLRFNQLQRLMPLVTQRMLTKYLRELESYGVIHREVYAEVPPRVEYTLTPLGYSLQPVLDAITSWGLAYLQTHPEITMNSPADMIKKPKI